ncbi:hypothetical protein KG112_17865 [Nocardioides sp. zg-ZUI104]|uniref:hypothetical protein n=1 Tax=Nocardioides faecalis TaxID=2803858 RepID=UPI001BCD283B|nr:hypothetical protein [Nocardioides faecalis]MBS4754678.1 hypothetical protein [Nocardioides faecalis]
MRLLRRARLHLQADLPGDVAGLRAALAAAPPVLQAELVPGEVPGRERLRVSSGYATPYGGARAVGDLDVTPQPRGGLRIEGELRSGRLNHVVLVAPLAMVAALLLGFGLLCLLVEPDALGLVLLGAFFGAGGWLVRRTEESWLRTVAGELTDPDGSLGAQLRRVAGGESAAADTA